MRSLSDLDHGILYIHGLEVDASLFKTSMAFTAAAVIVFGVI